MKIGFAVALTHAGSAYGAEFSFPEPQTYGSGTACAAPFVGTLNIPTSQSISGLTVRFRASHPYRSDTNLSITSPLGTVVELLVGSFGVNFDNYNVVFDDAATVNVDAGVHAVNQSTVGPAVSVTSEGDLLGTLDGENSAGTWTYSLCDVYPTADDGNLLELTIILPDPPVAPDLEAEKSVRPYPDGAYSTPGNDIIYTISVDNNGTGPVDLDTMLIIDSIPAEIVFYNGDMDDAGILTSDAVAFDETSSSLLFTYASDVKYSDAIVKPANFAGCTYVPILGYDDNLKHICFNPKGSFAAGGANFTLSYRAQIK